MGLLFVDQAVPNSNFISRRGRFGGSWGTDWTRCPRGLLLRSNNWFWCPRLALRSMCIILLLSILFGNLVRKLVIQLLRIRGHLLGELQQLLTNCKVAYYLISLDCIAFTDVGHHFLAQWIWVDGHKIYFLISQIDSVLCFIHLILINPGLIIFALTFILVFILKLINFMVVVQVIAPQVAVLVILATKVFLLRPDSLLCVVVVHLTIRKFGTIAVVTDLVDLVESHWLHLDFLQHISILPCSVLLAISKIVLRKNVALTTSEQECGFPIRMLRVGSIESAYGRLWIVQVVLGIFGSDCSWIYCLVIMIFLPPWAWISCIIFDGVIISMLKIIGNILLILCAASWSLTDEWRPVLRIHCLFWIYLTLRIVILISIFMLLCYYVMHLIWRDASIIALWHLFCNLLIIHFLCILPCRQLNLLGIDYLILVICFEWDQLFNVLVITWENIVILNILSYICSFRFCWFNLLIGFRSGFLSYYSFIILFLH